MFDHRIKNREQLAHASDQGDFEQFALGRQTLVEVPNHGITSGSDQGGHVQSTAHRGSAAPDGAPTFERAAVAVEGGHTDERGNLFAIQGSKLRQLGEQGAAGDRTDALSTAQQLVVLFPDRALLDGSVELLVGALEFLFQPADMGVDAFCDGLGGHRQPVVLGRNHLEDLSSSRGERSEFQSHYIGQGAQLWTNHLSEVRQDSGIDAVGLGQLSGGFSEVSDLAWVDHDHRQIGTHQSARDLAFIATGRFKHDQGGLDLSQPFDQGLDAGLVVGKRFFLTSGADRDIELCFGHIDADEDKGNFQNAILLNF